MDMDERAEIMRRLESVPSELLGIALEAEWNLVVRNSEHNFEAEVARVCAKLNVPPDALWELGYSRVVIRNHIFLRAPTAVRPVGMHSGSRE